MNQGGSHMTADTLTREYEDLSTDAGFQFRFHCERCGAAYVSHFQPCAPEPEGLLETVGELLADAQHDASEEHIAKGHPEHEGALRAAVAEVAEHFHECPRCGDLVCDACWHRAVLACEKCIPSEARSRAS